MKYFFFALLMAASLALLASCGGSDESESAQTASQQTEAAQPAGEVPAAAAALSTSCTKCHGLDRVCAKIGSLDKAGWATVMAQMIQKGANIDRPTALGAAEFLGQQPDMAKAALCN